MKDSLSKIEVKIIFLLLAKTFYKIVIKNLSYKHFFTHIEWLKVDDILKILLWGNKKNYTPNNYPIFKSV